DIAREISGAAPARFLAEAGSHDAANLDTPPRLAGGVALTGVVVGAIAADDGDVMTVLDQPGCQIAGVLCCRRAVGIERLIENENSHRWKEGSRRSDDDGVGRALRMFLA